MQRTIVNTKTVIAISYDAEFKVLEVEFRDGRILRYSEISIEVYTLLLLVQGFDEEYFYQNIYSKC